MSHPTPPTLRFDSPAGLPLDAAFDAGRLTSDGGLPWLAEADAALGLAAALAACIPDWRRGTDDPAHGEQEGVGYHGYYRQHMYHPLLAFDGNTGHLITAILRPGRCHGSRFAVLVLRRLVRRLRQAWPQVAIELRADR